MTSFLQLTASFASLNTVASRARFLPKNERISDSLKKTSDSLIHSFLVSNLSDSLTLIIFGEQPETFPHIAHQKRGNELIANFLSKKDLYKTY